MGDGFLHLLRVVRVHRQNLAQIAVQDRAARELELARVAEAIGRQIAVGQVIGQAAADGAPVLVKRRDGQQVGNINLFDEGLGVGQQFANVGETLGVDGVGLVDVQRARRAADEIIRVRVLAAENRVDLDNFLLPFQRLEVMRHAQQVRLRRQLHGRMAPVAVGEDAELAAGDEVRTRFCTSAK